MAVCPMLLQVDFWRMSLSGAWLCPNLYISSASSVFARKSAQAGPQFVVVWEFAHHHPMTMYPNRLERISWSSSFRESPIIVPQPHIWIESGGKHSPPSIVNRERPQLSYARTVSCVTSKFASIHKPSTSKTRPRL